MCFGGQKHLEVYSSRIVNGILGICLTMYVPTEPKDIPMMAWKTTNRKQHGILLVYLGRRKSLARGYPRQEFQKYVQNSFLGNDWWHGNGLSDCRLLTLQTPKALRGPRLFRRTYRRSFSFHTSTSFFQFVFIFGAAQKIIKNRTSIKSFQNLKNRTPGCPKLDFGAILDPPHPPGAGRVKLHGYNQKPN